MKKILVIDDEKFMRRTIISALREEGFQTLETENGADGVHLARSRQPDLILCDVRMEKMDGYATLAAMRGDPATATIPFILMTAAAERQGMRQGMALGADDYLAKPFSVDDLVSTVNAQLAKHSAFQRQAEQKLAELRASISFSLPHELLTPLNGIVGFSELLKADAAALSIEDTVEMADAINQSAHELHRVIQNYLIFAQIELLSTDEARKAALLHKRTVVSAAMLRGIVGAIAQPAHRLTDVRVEVVESRVMMSEEYFRKVVQELVSNALRFSTSGSPVQIATKVDPAGFALTVSDQGRGLTPQQLAEMPGMKFEHHIEAKGGIGLGVVLARRLAEIHGGRLTISSEAGSGTTVEVRLPAVGT